jgi:hypothetical protein
MDKIDILLAMLESIFKDMKSRRRKKIDISSTAFTLSGQPFQLYVGTEGNVTYRTEGGDTGTEKLIAGYHPCNFIFIDTAANGTTATDLTACFNG